MTARVALVTGGSGSIGHACARRLVRAGYDVVITARNEARLAAAASEIGASYIRADCSVEDDVVAVVGSLARLDIVVHAAGVFEGATLRDGDRSVFDRVVNSNLRSSYLVASNALPKMEAGSKLVFISSTTSLKGQPGMGAYSAAKAGTNALAQALAAEVESDGIGVHVVIPGPVDTPMLPQRGTFALRPEDVAEAVVWLAGLHPSVIIHEIVMRAAMRGPFATPDARPIGR